MFKEDKNELILSGRIVNIFPARGCVIVTLYTSNQTFPKVVCWQENAEQVLSEHRVNDNIHAAAQKRKNESEDTYCEDMYDDDLSDIPFWL